MLSVAKLTPGQERYYERSVAAGLDDYYAGRGESPGVWAGRGAAGLGLDGVVADGDLGRLIDGTDPATGRRLRRHGGRAHDHRRADRPATGETRAIERRSLAPVAGFDLVFSVPKSVSLLHALGDARMRDAVQQAHDSAWSAAIAYLEDEACVARTRRNGGIREHAEGFVAAAFQHRTSRAQDPHLHTHVIVAKRGPQAPTASGAPSTARRSSRPTGSPPATSIRPSSGPRSRGLGVEWRDTVKGMAEIQGIPQRVLAEFSQRRRADRGGARRRRARRLARGPGRRPRYPRAQGGRRPARPSPGVARPRRGARPQRRDPARDARPRATAEHDARDACTIHATEMALLVTPGG